MFVVPCEGSEAEALKYMRGVNLAWVARASLSEENWFGPAAASLALPAQQPGVRSGVSLSYPSLRAECGVECQVWTGVTQTQLSSGGGELEPALISWLALATSPLSTQHSAS